MAADKLAPCIAKSSAVMVFIMQAKRMLVFHGERFQPTELLNSRHQRGQGPVSI